MVIEGEYLTFDRFGSLACVQVGDVQCVVDLQDMRSMGRFSSKANGLLFSAFLVSQWRQWFGLEQSQDDRYARQLRSVSVETGETLFVTKPMSQEWSLILGPGRHTICAIHTTHGLLEFDRRTGEIVSTRRECRDFHCVEPLGVALVQRGQRAVWLEFSDRRQMLDVKGMRQFLDVERDRHPPPYARSRDVDLDTRRSISLFEPTLARSILFVCAEASLLGFSVQTGELVFTMSPLKLYQLAYHPERDTLLAMGWKDHEHKSRVLMEIDFDTRRVIWARQISCLSADGKSDPAGFLCDRGRYAILPDRTLLHIGDRTIQEMHKDAQ